MWAKRPGIPREWQDIDQRWLEEALRKDFPDIAVKDVDVLFADSGTNRRARLAASYGAQQGPAQFFLKAHSGSHAWTHLRNGNLFNEARLFASDVELPLAHPKVYLSLVDYLRLDFLLLMEDITLQGAEPLDATRALTVEQARNGVRDLAALHSKYWNQKRKTPALRWVKTWRPAKGWLVGLSKRIPMGIDRFNNGDAGEVPYTARQLLDAWVAFVDTLRESPMTLLHGDAHIGNTYLLPDQRIGFLDWQVVRWGQWSQDVGYFLQGAMHPEGCRSAERELLNDYREALQLPEQEKPSFDQLWQGYRQSAAYGLAIWLSTLGTDGWQSPEVCRALVQRYLAAFESLQTLAALD